MFIASKILRCLTYSKYRHQLSILKSINKLQNGIKSIHCSPILNVKMYIEHENIYAYNLMANKGYTIGLGIEKSKSSLTKEQFELLLKEDWKTKAPSQIFEAFSTLSIYGSEHNICISEKIFDNFIDNLTDNIKLASDKELTLLFQSLNKWPETESIRTRNYIEVWVALDDVCMDRMKIWSFDEMLSFIALFYMLNVTKASDFSRKSLQKLASKAKQLMPSQLVQTMFFICVLRQQPFDMHNLEVHLEDNFFEFSVDDLAIMSMGFFKTKTPLRSMGLVSKIIDKVVENSTDIHEVSLAALAKIIRYSMKVTSEDKIYRLLHVLQYEVPRVSVMCNVHIALLGTSTLTLHKDCLTKIAETVVNSISETRLKDLERLVLTYGTFNFITPTTEHLLKVITDELRDPRRAPEIEKYGRCLVTCLAYLGLVGIYPIDLISKVLSSEFLERSYGKQCYFYGREVLTVHNTVEIFFGEAKINRLSEKHARIMAKKYTDFVPNQDFKKQYNVTERMYLDIFNVLKVDRGGSEYVVGDHILTHHQRGDIIICNSCEGSPLPVTETFNNKNFGLLRRPPDDNHWIVFVIAGRNAIIYNSDTPTGHFHTKIRELKALGFYATLVPWTSYSSLKTNEEKKIYLDYLMKEAMK